MIKKNLIIAGAVLLAATSLLVYQEYARADITTGLIAHWALDEGTGSTTADVIGSNTGTLNGTMLWVAGKIGNYAVENRYNGGNDYIYANKYNNVTTFGTNMSASVWFKEIYQGHNYGMISNGFNGTGWYFYDRSGSDVLCAIYTTGGQNTFATFYTGFLDSNWHLFTCTYDGSNIRAYFDGALTDPNSTVVTTGTITADSDSNFYIPSPILGNGAMTGYYDDVCLWNRTLSDADVTALYNSTTGCTAGAATTPITPKVEIEAPMSLQAPAIIQ